VQEVIPSPCKRLCVLENGVCQGCGRLVSEITDWRDFSNEQKRAVWDRLEKFNTLSTKQPE